MFNFTNLLITSVLFFGVFLVNYFLNKKKAVIVSSYIEVCMSEIQVDDKKFAGCFKVSINKNNIPLRDSIEINKFILNDRLMNWYMISVNTQEQIKDKIMKRAIVLNERYLSSR